MTDPYGASCGPTDRTGSKGGPGFSDSHTIGSFLRSRRGRIPLAATGLPSVGQRRVAGLRHEEIAQLAGVSVDYYVRLEQGRTPHVSDGVLRAVATVLRLSPDEFRHLRALAHPPAVVAEHVPVIGPGVRRLLDTMEAVPAFVLGRRTDILAWNALGDAVFGFNGRHPSDLNLARYVFLNEDARRFHADDWPDCAAETVMCLGVDVGRHPHDAQLAALVEELCVKSSDFHTWWVQHDIVDLTYGSKRFRHPAVGALEFTYQSLAAPNEPDQILVTFSAESGSLTATRLRRLVEEALGAPAEVPGNDASPRELPSGATPRARAAPVPMAAEQLSV